MRNFTCNGFFNILKPPGPTSSDIVARVRKITGGGKTGHLGTLDPLAAGVLPIACGKAVKLFEMLAFKEKRYRAVFTFGTETDTGDSAGKVTEENGIIPPYQAVEEALKGFTGEIDQIPHRYSAVNINGSKAYRLAREGQDFELKSKKVTVSRFEIVRRDGNNYTFDIVCSGGTYIRSLCRDLAAALGAKAYMSMLIRLGSGIFDIGQSVPVEALEKDFDKYLLPITYPLKGIERFDSEPKNYRRLLNGNEVFVKSADKKQALIYCNNEFFGIGAVKNNILKVNVNLKYD